MKEQTRENAIERRLDYLEGIWNEFAQNSQPRMLRWLTDSDEAKMVELLIELQNEEVGEVPDLFIRFHTPFTDFNNYGFQLVEELKKQYEEIREGIAAEGVAADWTCPQYLSNGSDRSALLLVCTSFREYYEKIMEKLVLFLTPESVNDMNEFRNWLLLILRSGLPENIRISVIDLSDNPQLTVLCQTEPVLITTVEPKLDMPDAYEELAEQPFQGGPGANFRRHFVALLNASSKGDLKKVAKSSEAALKIARKQNWQQLQVVILMAVGATYLNQRNIETALQNYRLARECSNKIMESGDSLGAKLTIQTMFAEGGALVSDGRFPEAAKVYEQIVPLTVKQEDHLLTVEAWRMSAYCYEALNNFREAWRCGNKALDAGILIDEDMRKNTTLPYVGQGLQRLVGKEKGTRELEDKLRKRMVEIVGIDWEKNLSGEKTTS